MEEESELPWDKSKARQILWQDLVKRKVPLYANNNPEMTIESIYAMHPQYSAYNFSRFIYCLELSGGESGN